MWNKWRSLREFEALRAVIDTGTTTAAARRLGISQSAISRAIAQLEARMNRLLFNRESGRVQPTAEAMSLNENLDKLFEVLAKIDGSEWRTLTSDVLRIVAPPTIAHSFLSRRLVGFLNLHSGLRVSFDVCASDALLLGIVDERYDVGIISGPSSRTGVSSETYLESSSVCIMPANHHLRRHDMITPAMLDGEAFVALNRRFDARVRHDQIFSAAHVAPDIIVEATTTASVCEMVSAGLGIALINPFPVLISPNEEIVCRPFEPSFTWRASFVYPSSRPLTAAARAFIRYLRMTTPKYPFTKLV